MSDGAPTSFAGDLAARYEGLRGEVLGERTGRRPDHGWFVFVRQGMAAWMRACSKAAPQADAGPGNAKPGVHAELVVLLAGMILGRATRGPLEVSA